MIFKKKNLHLL